MAYTRLRVILVAGLLYVLFLLNVVLLGVSIPTYYQLRILWGSIALLVLKVYYRVQTTR